MLFLSRRFYTFSILVILLLCGGYLFVHHESNTDNIYRYMMKPYSKAKEL